MNGSIERNHNDGEEKKKINNIRVRILPEPNLLPELKNFPSYLLIRRTKEKKNTGSNRYELVGGTCRRNCWRTPFQR